MESVVRWVGGRWRPARAAAVAALAFSAGACGSMINMMPDPASFRLPDRSTFVPTRSTFNYNISPTTAVGPADLVDAQGQCAAPAAAAETRKHGVSLDMTECTVVHILGQPQSIDIPTAGSPGFLSTGNLDQRRVVLTYRTGERPGIYEFTAGRLTGIGRGEDTPPPTVAKKPPTKRGGQQPPA